MKKPQRAVLTFKDSKDGKSIEMRLLFIPAVSKGHSASGAVTMAMHALVAVTNEISLRNKLAAESKPKRKK